MNSKLLGLITLIVSLTDAQSSETKAASTIKFYQDDLKLQAAATQEEEVVWHVPVPIETSPQQAEVEENTNRPWIGLILVVAGFTLALTSLKYLWPAVVLCTAAGNAYVCIQLGSWVFYNQTILNIALELVAGLLLTVIFFKCFRRQALFMCLYLFCLMSGVQIGYMA